MGLNPTLLGIAMDVSGTMQMSIQNNAGADLSRIDALTKAFNFMIAATRLTAQKLSSQGEFPLRTFAYVYGLNTSPGYLDLFTLLKHVQTATERPEYQAFSHERRRTRYIDAKKRDTGADFERVWPHRADRPPARLREERKSSGSETA